VLSLTSFQQITELFLVDKVVSSRVAGDLSGTCRILLGEDNFENRLKRPSVKQDRYEWQFREEGRTIGISIEKKKFIESNVSVEFDVPTPFNVKKIQMTSKVLGDISAYSVAITMGIEGEIIVVEWYSVFPPHKKVMVTKPKMRKNYSEIIRQLESDNFYVAINTLGKRSN